MSQESEELVKVCIRIRPEYENTTFIEKIDDKVYIITITTIAIIVIIIVIITTIEFKVNCT
jgi:hypothetical protein